MIRLWLRRIGVGMIAGLSMLALVLTGRLSAAKARARRLQDDLRAEQARREINADIEARLRKTQARHREEQRESDDKLARGERTHLEDKG